MKTPAENLPENNPSLPDEFQDLPAEERELMAALRQNVQHVRPNARFASELQQELAESAANPAGPNLAHKTTQALKPIFQTLSWAGLAVILALGLAWVFQNTRPAATSQATSSPQAPAAAGSAGLTTPASPSTPAPTAQSPAPEATSEVQSSPTPAAEANWVSSPYLPGDRLTLNASLPDGPAQQTLYQLISGTALNVETARAKARQLGIEGHVYNTASEGGGPILVVSDGVQRVLFIGSADTFFLDTNMLTAPEGTLNLPPLETQIKTAETWLKAHNLLNFTYTISTDLGQPGQVRFVQRLENLPIFGGQNRPVCILVNINEQGQVKRVESAPPAFQPVSLPSGQALPIRSAAQAWADIQTGDPSLFSSSSALEITTGWPFTSTVQTWGRRYPIGQPIQMFGYLDILQPAEPGGAPLVTFNNYLLTGNTTSLLQNANIGVFLHLMGSLEYSAAGSQVFKTTGWQTSSFVDEALDGTLEFQNGKSFLVTASRGRLYLPDAPSELQTAIQPGTIVNVRGIVLEGANPEMDWMFIQTGATSSGGGGGGGFKELNLSGSPVPTPTAAPLPAIGERIEGLIGYPTMTIHQYADGATSTETTIGLESTLPGTEIGGLVTTAQGAGLAGLENYLRLPVRVWGAITAIQNNKPVLTVERFEPLYPGLHYQVFVGRYEAVSLDGKTVLRLTTLNNQVYVLESSVNFGASSAVGRPGDLIIVEGAAFPDRSYAGYPLITESGASMVSNQSQIDNYVIRSAQPDLVVDNAPAPGRSLIIDQVDLVYYAPDLRGVGYNLPAFSTSLYIQPAWRFSGRYQDGTPIVILVQAAAPAYIK